MSNICVLLCKFPSALDVFNAGIAIQSNTAFDAYRYVFGIDIDQSQGHVFAFLQVDYLSSTRKNAAGWLLLTIL